MTTTYQNRKLVKTYEETTYCSSCDLPVEFTGAVLMTSPAKFRHRCPECDNVFNLGHESPRTVYEYENGEES